MRRFRASRASARHLWIVLVGFVLTAASFLGATVYEDSRLEHVNRLAHDVSDNAMPSLVHIGTMRRELADIHSALEEASEGEEGDPSALEEHLRELEDARAAYERVPQFAGETEVWARAQPMLDEVPHLVVAVMGDVKSGRQYDAEVRVDRDFVPVEAMANAALLELRRINIEEGTHAARSADRAWLRARRVSIALDLVCVVLTAGLAVIALRSGRRYIAAEERRVEELDAFAARVAHDIRGPLTPPLFALQCLADDLDASSPRRHLVDRGLRSLNRAERLVDDLLTYARAAAEPDLQAHASLRVVVAGVLQDLEPAASEARVEVEVAPLPAGEVACAPGVLSSIVSNLVSNAIKYMPPDSESRLVSIRAYEEAKHVRVEVADTGAGLPEGDRERVFEPFVRVDGTKPGIGLGLATVKRLVEALGGRVGVLPRSGHGAIFWFEMPASRVAESG
ncbi:MAG TPA: HAMP domain-containing sensor histidine kinase [Polyangiaceae bacterium]|jgi:signal transduction histidine kinase